MSFIEVKQKKKPTKYSLKFSVLSIDTFIFIIKKCLSLKLKKKKEMLKKENKIFSKQFVTTEPTKYGLRKKTFWWMSFVGVKQKQRNVWKKKRKYLVNNSLE